MKETSGNRDVNNGGAPSGVTAASAIAAMQEQSGKLSRDQIRVSYKTFRAVVSCVIELIRQFYDAPRQFRITGEAMIMTVVLYALRLNTKLLCNRTITLTLEAHSAYHVFLCVIQCNHILFRLNCVPFRYPHGLRQV
jgi:hypothetical protein